MNTGADLLAGLGLDPDEQWDGLRHGQRGFMARHLASGRATVGDVAGALRASGLTPPRTGHLADWDDIWDGCSSVLDYNAVVCRDLGIGYPLLFDFTQSETVQGDAGDTLFQPGAVFRRGRRMRLPLRHWNGTRMVTHDRSRPLLVPYLEAEFEGAPVALSRLHRRRMRTAPARVGIFSDTVWGAADRVRELLGCLVESAVDDRRLGMVFDRVVRPDGTVMRVAPQRDGTGFRMGETCYSSPAALVEASLVPFAVATSDEPLPAILREIPAAPLASVDVVALCHAVLGTHRPATSAVGSGPDIHVHWGALAMAGAPPRRKGYFANRIQRARWMYESAVAGLSWVRPTLFVMAPVAPFFLWLPERAVGDRAALDDLLDRVRRVVPPDRLSADRAVPAVRAAVADWAAAGALSAELRCRFGWRDRAGPDDAEPAGGPLVAPTGGMDLPVRTACLLVGVLAEAVAASVPGSEKRATDG